MARQTADGKRVPGLGHLLSLVADCFTAPRHPPDVIAYGLAPPQYSELSARQCDAWLSATSCSLDEVACSTVMASWRPSRASSRVASATSRSRRSLSSRPISTDSSTLSV